MRWGRLVGICLAVAPLGCNGPGLFACSNHQECANQGIAGTCEDNGYCSFPDATCPSGQRFGDAAPGDIAGKCVDEVSGTSGPVTTSATVATPPASSTTNAASESGMPPPLTSGGESTGSSGSPPPASSSTDGGDGGTTTTGGQPVCSTQPDGSTLAHYRLGSMGDPVDIAGDHDGTWEVGAPMLVDGPEGCGMASEFDGTTHGMVGAHDDFHLTEGSFDLWVRVGPAPIAAGMGIVSRDALGADSEGHITLFYTPEGRIAARHQALLSTPDDHLVCSDEVAVQDEWLYVGVNFGPPGLELYINGTQQAGTGQATALMNARDCTDGVGDFGIDGNDHPWFIGATGALIEKGTADPPSNHFIGGIDEFRISNSRRDFAD